MRSAKDAAFINSCLIALMIICHELLHAAAAEILGYDVYGIRIFCFEWGDLGDKPYIVGQVNSECPAELWDCAFILLLPMILPPLFVFLTREKFQWAGLLLSNGDILTLLSLC